MKKTIIYMSIGMVVIAAILTVFVLKPFGSDYDEFSTMSIENEIAGIMIFEKTMDSLDYTREQDRIILSEILEEHEERVLHLRGWINEGMNDNQDFQHFDYLSTWCDEKLNANQLGRELITELEKLDEAQSDDELEEIYSKVVQHAFEMEESERNSITCLLEYQVLRDKVEESSFQLADLIPEMDVYANDVVLTELQDKLTESVVPSEEQIESADKVYPPAFFLERGHDDRLPLAKAICFHDEISLDDLVFLRHMKSDGDWAFVISSPGNDVQVVRQYIARKVNGNWSILSSFDSDVRVSEYLQGELADFNINTLPAYEMADYQVQYMTTNEQQYIHQQLARDGHVSSETYIYYLSRINDILFLFFKDNTRLLVEMDDMNIKSVTKLDHTASYSSYKSFLTSDGPEMIFIQD